MILLFVSLLLCVQFLSLSSATPLPTQHLIIGKRCLIALNVTSNGRISIGDLRFRTPSESSSSDEFTANLLLQFRDGDDSGFVSGSSILIGERWFSPQTTNATSISASNATKDGPAYIQMLNAAVVDDDGKLLARESMEIQLLEEGEETAGGETLRFTINRTYFSTVEVTAERSPALVLQPSGSHKGAQGERGKGAGKPSAVTIVPSSHPTLSRSPQ